MTRRVLISGIALAVLALLVAACGSAAEPGDTTAPEEGFTKNADGYTDIGVEELVGLLDREEVTLVNVHIPYEGELPETDLFIPYDEIADHIDQLPDKEAPVILYCRSGSMSTYAAQELVELGYTNVLEVDGGFNAWKSAGYDFLSQ